MKYRIFELKKTPNLKTCFMKKCRRFTTLLAAILFQLPLFSQNQNIAFRSEMTFSGQTVANVCGYAANGREYALAGASKGMIIVDITDPDNPVQIVQIPNIDDEWKEIKVFQHYAYITTEGETGALQIVDLNNLPSPNLPYHTYNGDGAIAGQLSTIHSLHIDTAKANVYLYGSNLATGGALVLDLNQDPYNPVYLGQYNLNYIHDGYVNNDTLYGCHIYDGYFSIIDFQDKNNPIVLQTQHTPSNFTHNSWLSIDHKTLFTTDETSNSFLTAYDISDISNIHELDRIQSNPGSASIVHNTHILDDYAITSWYRDGVTIVDAHRPANLIQVANYDTYDGSGSGFDGAWGVYPFLPSGTLVVSNIDPGKIIMLSPTYIRACYLEGTITDAVSGASINNVHVEISGGNPQSKTLSGLNGKYATGQLESGSVTVTFSKAGYVPQTLTAELAHGEVTLLDVQMTFLGAFSVGGNAVADPGNTPVPGALVKLVSIDNTYEITADGNGHFSLNGVLYDTYTLYAGAWGYHNIKTTGVEIHSNTTSDVVLPRGYQDDFIFDYGWTVSGNASDGSWERGEPLGVNFGGFQIFPEEDVPTDIGDQCYVTGNNGVSYDDDDVDNGQTILTSPAMDLSNYVDPVVSFYTYFFDFNNLGLSTDNMEIWVDNGTNQQLLKTLNADFNLTWNLQTFHLKDYVTLSDQMRIYLIAQEYEHPNVPFNILESGLDAFLVAEGSSGTENPVDQAVMTASPNPFDQSFTLTYSFPEENGILRVSDISGRLVEQITLDQKSGNIVLGQQWASGFYVAQWVKGDRKVNLKMIKM